MVAKGKPTVAAKWSLKNFAYNLRPHISLSLLCEELNAQNPPRELLGNYARTLGSSVGIARGG